MRLRTPAASLAIHGAVLALLLALIARSLAANGLFAWGVGLIYITYDTALLAFTAVQTWRLTRPPPPTPPGLAPITLGVVIAAHNEAASLPATIAALRAQTEPPEVIIIADDGSTDSTATALPPAPDLRVLSLPRGGKARALNASIATLHTDVVVTVDADTLLDPSALAAMRRAFAADPALVAATGVLTPVCSGGTIARVFAWFQTYEYIRNFMSRFAWMGQDSLLLISGAFAGFRRQAVLQAGGFDPDCLVEDYELIHRLYRYAQSNSLIWRTAVLGDCTATTDAPATPLAFLRQRRRWFGGFLQTQYWYRDMVGNRAYGRLGTRMLPVKAADTVQPIYGLIAFILLLSWLGRGQFGILLPVGGVILAKIAIDLCFHLWSVHLYRRWTGTRTRARFLPALLAALAEPFSFQLLRHLGAGWGWLVFLRGARGGVWG
jgi:cellulose synthase/poly-beta-1,6-N-acetylglucosamine synthase-like glycosyltransferase